MNRHAYFGVTVAAVAVLGAEVPASPRPAVIELYTSQGCNSCPPADALLGEFACQPNVLALAFHVDYWNDLGWTDRFGLADSAVRQSTYARALGHASIYTPQVIVDGRQEYLGSDRQKIQSAIDQVRTGVPITLSTGAGSLVIELGGAQCLAPSDVLAVTFTRKAVSRIGKGENSGRTLEEFNIVRSIQKIGQWNGAAVSFRLPLSTLPAEATDVAVLVQAPGQAQIIGAAARTVPGQGPLTAPREGN
jgi:hypothetical protein